MKKLLILLTILIGTCDCCFAAHQYLEKEYQSVWCKANNGVTEVVLADGARVDCVTKDYAIEFDFASKWAESIGQALYYGNSLSKTAGVVLILENPKKDQRYLDRLKCVADKHNIKVWTMTTQDMPPRRECRR